MLRYFEDGALLCDFLTVARALELRVRRGVDFSVLGPKSGDRLRLAGLNIILLKL